MTTKVVCSVLDIKGGFYSAPFVSYNEDMASREFGAVVRDSNSLMSKFPEDFRLVCLAEFDDVSGRLTVRDNPQFLVDPLAFIKE